MSWAVAVDVSHVYFGATNGLMRIRKGGGAPELVAPASRPTIGSIALDDGSVYWATTQQRGGPPVMNDWVVYRKAKGGGAQETLASDQNPIPELLVDDRFVWGRSARTST